MADSDIVVFQLISRGDSKCDECGRELFKGSLLRREGERGLCVDCADLGHLVFVAAGDSCITLRATKYSPLRAIVLRFSRSRGRYERLGTLVHEEALALAPRKSASMMRSRQREIGASALVASTNSFARADAIRARIEAA